MSVERVRAYRAAKQGLLAVATSDPATCLTEVGWLRSVGGANPYLGLFARTGAGREAIDASLARREIQELPSARGCTYVLPSANFALGLAVARGFGDAAEVAGAMKHLEVTSEELVRLGQAILRALGSGPMGTAALRDACGDAVRNLGAAGKKRGVSTTLSLALGQLQAQGQIRRVPTNGRLDQQRYDYALWLDGPTPPDEKAQPEWDRLLAAHYWRWIGPASEAHFRWFSGFTARRAKAAMAGLGLTPVDGSAELMLLPDEAPDYAAFEIPDKPTFRLVGSLDNVLLLTRDLGALLSPEDAERTAYTERGRLKLAAMGDLNSHLILDRGRLIGLWDFDPEQGEIVALPFVSQHEALTEEIAKTERFVRDELGDARSFSLDSPASRQKRLASLRAAALA